MSCTNNSPNINQTFIIESNDTTPIISGCTGIFTNVIKECDGDAVKIDSNVNLVGNLVPNEDKVSDLGIPTKRFREINAHNGTTSVWNVTKEIITPNLNLGQDDEGNNRNITSNNSIIRYDTLLGGTY